MTESMSDSQPGDRAKLTELIRAIRIALLTTVDRDGHFHTRPVETMRVDEGETTLWFFTDWSSPKVDDIHHDVRVIRKKQKSCGASSSARITREAPTTSISRSCGCASSGQSHADRGSGRRDWREP